MNTLDITVLESYKIPTKSSKGAIGYDLYASEDIAIGPKD